MWNIISFVRGYIDLSSGSLSLSRQWLKSIDRACSSLINRQVVTLLFDRVNADDEAAAIAAAASATVNATASSSVSVSSAAAAAAAAADIQPRGSRRVRRVDAAAVCARQQQLMQQAAEPHSPAPEQQHALQCMSRTARCCWLLLHDLCLLCAGEHSLHDSLWLKLRRVWAVADGPGQE